MGLYIFFLFAVNSQKKKDKNIIIYIKRLKYFLFQFKYYYINKWSSIANNREGSNDSMLG